jgi:hypothetical protein
MGSKKKWVFEESYKHSKIFAAGSGISGTKLSLGTGLFR